MKLSKTKLAVKVLVFTPFKCFYDWKTFSLHTIIAFDLEFACILHMFLLTC